MFVAFVPKYMILVECRDRLVGFKFRFDLNLIKFSNFVNETVFCFKLLSLSPS